MTAAPTYGPPRPINPRRPDHLHAVAYVECPACLVGMPDYAWPDHHAFCAGPYEPADCCPAWPTCHHPTTTDRRARS